MDWPRALEAAGMLQSDLSSAFPTGLGCGGHSCLYFLPPAPLDMRPRLSHTPSLDQSHLVLWILTLGPSDRGASHKGESVLCHLPRVPEGICRVWMEHREGEGASLGGYLHFFPFEGIWHQLLLLKMSQLKGMPITCRETDRMHSAPSLISEGYSPCSSFG